MSQQIYNKPSSCKLTISNFSFFFCQNQPKRIFKNVVNFLVVVLPKHVADAKLRTINKQHLEHVGKKRTQLAGQQAALQSSRRISVLQVAS